MAVVGQVVIVTGNGWLVVKLAGEMAADRVICVKRKLSMKMVLSPPFKSVPTNASVWVPAVTGNGPTV